MTFAPTADSDGSSAIAVGSGILAGLLTLTIVSGIFWLVGRSGDGDSAVEAAASDGPVSAAQLSVGDCADVNGTLLSGRISSVSDFVTIDCRQGHDTEITAKLAHPEAGAGYPGADALTVWAGERCTEEGERHVGADLLDTTLSAGTLLPNFEEWSAGDNDVTCYVVADDGSKLNGPTAAAAADFARGDEIRVSRLKPGDCFAGIDSKSVYELTSDNTVRLVGCDESHNGVFFARAQLPETIGSPFPGDAPVGDAANALCADQFQGFFGVGADGFNYRYWRPNKVGWENDDRVVLCSILENDPLVGEFAPSRYLPFFDVEPGSCFNLGPGEIPDSLRLDDQVLPLDCEEPHLGQMLGSGNLVEDDTEPFPGTEDVQVLAGAECEQLFVDFIGVSPFESELGEFPYWYPSETGWSDGDRRYGCAFLEENPMTGSFEGGGEN